MANILKQPEFWCVVTKIPNFYIVGEMPGFRDYAPGSPTIVLVDPMVVRVQNKKLAIEDYEAVEGEVTIILDSHAAVGKLRKTLYAPILQYLELKASGQSLEELAKGFTDAEQKTV
jgi:hypothetical protein